MANMFRCTLASGGGALVLTVTCDSAFSGQTITCTDGVTTLTQTCPSASPYTVEFKIPNGGTWTVSSGTDSVNVTISDTATLHHIPTGSTVTPTDDIQTWLFCAGIFDKTYTTISEVLSDSSTFLALVSDANAVDYMARSSTWASTVCADQTAMSYIGLDDYCADSLLNNATWLAAICNSTYFESVLTAKNPIMTNNTSPSPYVASANSQRTSEGMYAWKAFSSYSVSSGGSFDCWATDLAGTNVENWLQLKFNNPIKVSYVKMSPRTGGSMANFPTSWRLEGSNDGTTFTPISETINETLPTSNVFKSTPIVNDTKYQYIRVHTFGCFNDRTAIGRLILYGRS